MHFVLPRAGDRLTKEGEGVRELQTHSLLTAPPVRLDSLVGQFGPREALRSKGHEVVRSVSEGNRSHPAPWTNLAS